MGGFQHHQSRRTREHAVWADFNIDGAGEREHAVWLDFNIDGAGEREHAVWLDFNIDGAGEPENRPASWQLLGHWCFNTDI